MSDKPKNLSQAIEELERFQELIKDLSPQIEEIRSKVEEKAQKTKINLEEKVKENPWAALGIVGLIFFIFGFLFGFRGSRERD